MPTFGTNYPYGLNDVFNITAGNQGGTGGLVQLQPVGTAVIVHSFTTAGSGAGGTATSTAATGLAHWKELEVFVDVTFSQGAATNTLILFVDGRHPDGTAFFNIARFADITTAGMHIAHLTKARAAGMTSTVEVDAGAGTIRGVSWGDAIRVRRQITGTATTQFSATVYIWNQVV